MFFNHDPDFLGGCFYKFNQSGDLELLYIDDSGNINQRERNLNTDVPVLLERFQSNGNSRSSPSNRLSFELVFFPKMAIKSFLQGGASKIRLLESSVDFPWNVTIGNEEAIFHSYRSILPSGFRIGESLEPFPIRIN
ncbi:MAG: hypothetical protein R2795_20675 [Saprospiraceae bacterium]